MENASKALLIAGGVLLAILVISLFVVMRGNLQQYFKAQDDVATQEELAAFNSEFANYNRENVRGNELLSLINKVIDYNSRKSIEGKNDSQDTPITITMSFNSKRSELQYTEARGTEFLFESDSYTQSKTENTLKNVINKIDDIIRNQFDGKEEILQKISSNITTFYPDSTKTITLGEKLKAIDKFNSYVVGSKLETDKTKLGSNDRNDETKVNEAYKELTGQLSSRKIGVYQYYEYSQFKKAIFKCTKVEYYGSNGKIKKMDFVFTGDLK